MAFIGNTNTTQGFTPAIDYFSGNGSTTAFTLSRPVASTAQVQVTVNNVPQNPSTAYGISGNTLTFTSAPASGTNNIYVYYTSPITQVIAPSQGTVGLTQLSATGSPSSTTYLRGDNTWAVVGGAADIQQFDTTGTWTKPSGKSMARIQIWGAGGGGGRSQYVLSTSAGGGGAYVEIVVPISYLASTVTATVGVGGAGATANNTFGATGGNSSITLSTAFQNRTSFTAYGGGGGSYFGFSGGGGGGNAAAGTALGASSGGNGGAGFGSVNSAFLVGARINCGTSLSTYYGFPGGIDSGGSGSFTTNDGVTEFTNPATSSFFGGGGGGGITGSATVNKAGGNSAWGGGGGTATGGTAGTSLYGGNGGAGAAGAAPAGGGGSSTTAATNGFAGANGRIIITSW